MAGPKNRMPFLLRPDCGSGRNGTRRLVKPTGGNPSTGKLSPHAHPSGSCDVSTLGKIDIKGKDAREFVNRVYSNGFAKLPVGKVRYGLMLRDDGFVMDDGTTACMAEDHFIMTTTTANAGPVYRHLEFCRQGLWPELDVALISTTDQVAQFALAGPNSRRLLEKIVDPEFDISNAAFPFMAGGGADHLRWGCRTAVPYLLFR